MVEPSQADDENVGFWVSDRGHSEQSRKRQPDDDSQDSDTDRGERRRKSPTQETEPDQRHEAKKPDPANPPNPGR